MNREVLAFGIAREIFGSSSITTEVQEGATVADLRSALEERFPKLRALASYMVAGDDEYAALDRTLESLHEIAIIPPVSGG